MQESTKEVLNALVTRGFEVIYGKGGFWIKGQGFITLAQARKLTGIQAPKREFRPRVQAWGDWATVAMINGRRG
jgi:hypothetical protein